MFCSEGSVSGFESGFIQLNVDVTVNIKAGSGVLMLFTGGGATFEMYGVNYWDTTLTLIYKTGNVGCSLSKKDHSSMVSALGSQNRKIRYIFIGESMEQ